MLHVIATTIVGLPAALLFLCVCGQYVPLVGFSLLGAALSARTFGVAVVSSGLTVAAIALLIWSPSNAAWAALAAATSAFVGASLNGIHQLGLARRENVGVTIHPFRRPTVDVTPDAEEVYTTAGDEELSLSIWKAAARADRAPVIVMVHGGGWVSGSRASGTLLWHARWFADRGHLVVSVDYSLASHQRHLWNVQEEQIAAAIHWVVRNADRYGGDPRRIALLGESAGGNLVLNVGSRIAAGEWPLETSGTRVRISSISALYPGVDLRDIWYSRNLLLRRWLRSFTERYIGGPPGQYPDRYDAAASSTHIHPMTPPTLLAFGTSDHLVEPRTLHRYAQHLRDTGVGVLTIEVPHSGHGFDVEGSIGCQVYREVTLAWLRSHWKAQETRMGRQERRN